MEKNLEKSEQEINDASPLLRQCFVTLALCLNVICHGTMLGYPGILLPQLRDPDSPVKVTPISESWITSVVAISIIIGNFIGMPIMGRFGRKRAHFAFTVPLLLGWVVVILAHNVVVIVVARIIQGLSFGMAQPLRSALIGEYTSTKYRGAFLTTLSVSQTFGIFFVHLIGSLLHWKTAALICSTFSIVAIIMTFFSPESPSFLASKGRYDECRKAFHWLRGNVEEKELNEMIEANILLEKYKIEQSSRPGSHRISDTLNTIKKREFYKPITLMSFAFFMAQFAGGGTLSNYATIILGDLLEPGSNVYFWMVALDTLRLVCNLMAVFVVNNMKRRTLFFLVGFISVATHLVISLYVYLRSNGSLMFDAPWISIALISVQVLTLGFGMIPLPIVLAGEVYPLEYRSVGGGITVVFSTLWMFVVLKTFPSLMYSIGLEGTYLVYAGILAFNLVCLWFMLPETKGKTLQEIEEHFRGRPLNPIEMEERASLQADPVAVYKRTMSQRKMSSVSALC